MPLSCDVFLLWFLWGPCLFSLKILEWSCCEEPGGLGCARDRVCVSFGAVGCYKAKEGCAWVQGKEGQVVLTALCRGSLFSLR